MLLLLVVVLEVLRAGLLSKVGKKVLVLEQHYIVGGCMYFEKKKM